MSSFTFYALMAVLVIAVNAAADFTDGLLQAVLVGVLCAFLMILGTLDPNRR